ncbi:hypothetical protein EZ216_13750 [Ramlibacter humi]|uniref:Uncharacterized protein n=1 Tax=Ramlibacter humi TaxID=2530451 RepID=A0A4Z0BLG3_9BURK|nr:hypothetical protein EZ216_13750 [Ramlibacter humi]
MNQATAGEQDDASIAQLADGGYVVAWTTTAGPTVSPNPQGVCWQRFTREAAPVNSQVCIPSPTVARLQTAVAPLANGGFAVGWQVLPATYYADISTQVYDANSQPVGGVQRVNTTSNDEAYVDMAAVPGGVVFSWRDNAHNILTRRVGPGGQPLAAEQVANTFDSNTVQNGGGLTDPHVAALEDGGHIVVWTSQFQDGAPSTAIYYQRYDASGNRAGGETLVTDKQVQSLYPKVSGLAGGGWVIAWNSGAQAVAQRFAADGSRVGAQQAMEPGYLQGPPDTCNLPMPTPCPPFQNMGGVTGLADGSYVVTWMNSRGISQAVSLQARQYGTDGAPMGPATKLMDPVYGSWRMARADGGFMMAWSHEDDSGFGVYLRRFDAKALR